MRTTRNACKSFELAAISLVDVIIGTKVAKA